VDLTRLSSRELEEELGAGDGDLEEAEVGGATQSMAGEAEPEGAEGGGAPVDD
jgi:hypothetical protein